MHLTIDFETRGTIDLLKTGAWPYAEHFLTEPICLTAKPLGQMPGLYIFPPFQRYIDPTDSKLAGHLISEQKILEWIHLADVIEGHNVGFENSIWKECCVKKYNWPDIPEYKYQCSAAMAASMSLPRALDNALAAINAPIRKDAEGHAAMLKVCKPRAPRAREKAIYPNWEELVFWNDNPADYMKTFHYNIQDVVAEEYLSSQLRNLSSYETAVWKLDQRINTRGVKIDLTLAKSAIDVIKTYEDKLKCEIPKITQGQVQSVKQTDKAKNWLNSMGINVPNMQKATIAAAVKNLSESNADPLVKRFLEIRTSLSKSSTAKFKSMLTCVSKDGRFKDLLMYWGANTGRWAGKKIQVQNLPSRDLIKEINTCIDLIYQGDVDSIELYFGDVMKALSSCIRGCFIPENGYDFLCSDYSSIEGRLLAWLAFDNRTLHAYASGLCMYRVAASEIFGIPYDQILKPSKERDIGKVSELSLGYAGGWKAYKNMAIGYGVEPPSDLVLDPSDFYDYDGTKLSEYDARFKKWATPIIRAWRDNRPEVLEFWANAERAAILAIRTGQVINCGRVAFGKIGDWLHCRLPSGRLLSYYKPFIKKALAVWADKENPQPEDWIDTIHFWAVDSTTNKWRVHTTYGGKLVENVTQAVARDILAHAMLKAEAAGYTPVLHVHDELVCEVPEGFGSVEELEEIMMDIPAWAEGAPITAAGGWRGKRFRK